MTKANSSSKISNFPSVLLLIIGCVDLLRGFLHTFMVNWANSTFAKMDVSSTGNNQLFLLGIFGISNILTGLLYILISRKAKNLSVYVLGIIPLAYIVGLIGLRFSGIVAESAFLGKYFMYIYLGICALTSIIYLVKKK